MNNQIKFIRKALQMEIIKPQISVSITKTELNSLINEAMAMPDYAAADRKSVV